MRISDWSSDVCSSDLVADYSDRHAVAVDDREQGDLAVPPERLEHVDHVEVGEQWRQQLDLLAHQPAIAGPVAALVPVDTFHQRVDRPQFVAVDGRMLDQEALRKGEAQIRSEEHTSEPQ